MDHIYPLYLNILIAPDFHLNIGHKRRWRGSLCPASDGALSVRISTLATTNRSTGVIHHGSNGLN